nr:MAG TPA: neurotoxin [Caudoviricetes sp.]
MFDRHSLFYKQTRGGELLMRIDKFMNELSKMVFEHGDTCKVMTVIAKKSAEQERKSNLHPSMAQALAPFVKGLFK